MRLVWTLLAAVVVPTPGKAQSEADTSAVLLVAWDTLVGQAPYSHPEGETYLACLTSSYMGSRPRFEDLSPAVHETLARILREDRSVALTTGCTVDWTNTTRTRPMIDAEGRPAIDVQLTRLEFLTPNRVEVGMHVGAGARWGIGTRCIIEHQPDATWSVEDCRVIVQR